MRRKKRERIETMLADAARTAAEGACSRMDYWVSQQMSSMRDGVNRLDRFATEVTSAVRLANPATAAVLVNRIEELTELMSDELPSELGERTYDSWSYVLNIPDRTGVGIALRCSRSKGQMLLELEESDGTPRWRRRLRFAKPAVPA